MKTILMYHNDDIQWMKDTHLKGLSYPDFQSFMLFGNEDAPDRVDLFEGNNPAWDEKPVKTFQFREE